MAMRCSTTSSPVVRSSDGAAPPPCRRTALRARSSCHTGRGAAHAIPRAAWHVGHGVFPTRMPTHAALPDSSYSSVASVDEVPIKWYERPSQWHTVADISELEETLRNSHGKYVAVEFFAGWCSSCKSAYPALCRIPNDENIAAKFMFVKANIEDTAITQYIKQLSIKGIPHLAVFRPDGHFMLGMTSSFSRMAQVKTNLAVIAGNPGAKDFVADPNGFVVPRF